MAGFGVLCATLVVLLVINSSFSDAASRVTRSPQFGISQANAQASATSFGGRPDFGYVGHEGYGGGGLGGNGGGFGGNGGGFGDHGFGGPPPPVGPGFGGGNGGFGGGYGRNFGGKFGGGYGGGYGVGYGGGGFGGGYGEFSPHHHHHHNGGFNQLERGLGPESDGSISISKTISISHGGQAQSSASSSATKK